MQIWDRRSTGPNEALGECVLQLSTLHGNVQRLKKMQEVPRQWYTCTHPNHSGPQAKIDISIWMLPRAEAEQLDMVAGYGRGAPNEHPKLPPPRRGAQGRQGPLQEEGRGGRDECCREGGGAGRPGAGSAGNYADRAGVRHEPRVVWAAPCALLFVH